MFTIFGASGRIGGELLRQSLDGGHEVTAVVRGDLDLAHPRLTVVKADVMDPGAITGAVDGADAVLSALGPRGSGPTTVCTDGVRSIVTAMAKTGAQRLLVVSADGPYVYPEDGLLMRRAAKPIVQRALRHRFADLLTMEETIRNTDLNWTVVRPPRLTDGPLTRNYRTAIDAGLRGSSKISRADVADCMLGLATDPGLHRNTVALAY
jgi:putative NADH-flavin reductase